MEFSKFMISTESKTSKPQPKKKKRRNKQTLSKKFNLTKLIITKIKHRLKVILTLRLTTQPSRDPLYHKMLDATQLNSKRYMNR